MISFLCANDIDLRGPFEVNYGTESVEVSLASAAHSRLSAKAAADW